MVMGRRKKRTFTKEFQAEAVRLVVDAGTPLVRVARDLDIWPSTLETWVKKEQLARSLAATAAVANGDSLSTAERSELMRLRQKVLTLETEREILKKAAAFFAKENS